MTLAPTNVGPTTVTGFVLKTPRVPCKKRVPELQSGALTAFRQTILSLKIMEL